MTDNIEQVSVTALSPSPTNPRSKLTHIDELAESIKIVGVLEPLIARKLTGPKGVRNELVFGHRRLAAAKKAGLKTVPVIFKQYDDDQVLEIQIVENLQRVDVHPLDEADGIKSLCDAGKSYAEIAERISRPAEYVARRHRLSGLSGNVRRALLADNLTLGAAQQIAKLASPGIQDKAYKEAKSPWDILRETRAKDVIERHFLLKLSGAPWKLSDAELVKKAGACNACPKRTSAQAELFDGTSKTDLCLDRKCFQSKQLAMWARMKKDNPDGKFIEGKAAERALHWNGDYTELDDSKLIGNDRVKVSKIIRGADIEIVHVLDPDTNAIKKAVPKKALNEQINKKKPGSAATLKSEAERKADRKAELEKQRQEKTTIDRAISAAVKDRDYTDGKLDMLFLMATFICDEVDNDVAKAVIARAGLDPVMRKSWAGADKPTLQTRETLHKALAEGDDDDRRDLVLELILTDAAPGRYHGGKDVYKNTLAALDVDPKAIAREVAKERKEALAKKKKPAKKSASK